MTGTYHADSKGRDMEKCVEERACRDAWACIEDADFEQTGFSYTLSLIQGKYKMVILYCLMEFQPVRFNELRRYLKTVSDKTLSRALKELEADGLVWREAYPQIPPKVEYGLTERGASLMEVLDAMCTWGSKHRDWKKAEPSHTEAS